MSNSFLMEPAQALHPGQSTMMTPHHPLPNSHDNSSNNNSNNSSSTTFHPHTPVPATSDTAMPLPPQQNQPPPARAKPAKAHVPSACINCKKAHLACDLSRPCKRCISVGKDDTCRDVEHKKRGRPKLVDKALGAWGPSRKDLSVETAAGLAKTRVKGKYTKSANYKSSKKTLSVTPANPDHLLISTTTTTHADAAHQQRHQHQHQQQQQQQQLSSPYTPHSNDHMPTVVYRTPQQEYRDRPLSIHSEPDHASHDQHDTYYPSPPTTKVKQTQELYSRPTGALATLFLTMDFICARVSDESQALWGFHPHDISHKALHSIVASEDQAKMSSLLRTIKDAVFYAASPNAPQHLTHFPFLDSSSPVFFQNRPGIMSSSAPGSSEYTDVVRVVCADGSSDLFNIRLYVGGGLGTDLSRGLNIEHAYVVCIMSRHAVSTFSSYNRQPESTSTEEPMSSLYNAPSNRDHNRNLSRDHGHGHNSYLDSPYSTSHKQPQPTAYGSPYETTGMDSSRKISLPPIFSNNTMSSSTSALSMPAGTTATTTTSTTTTTPTTTAEASTTITSTSTTPSFAHKSSSMSSLLSSSTMFTVPLSKPSLNGSSLPSLRTEPLHTPKWLYDAEPFGDRLGGSYGSGQGSHSNRLPTVFADPFRAVSAPMGGFGVSKYLSRPEPTTSFSNIRRHLLPPPSPSAGSRGDSAHRPSPRTLQRDLSSSSFGASFGAQSPSSSCSMKRPLADMADSQDHTRDIDNRHQDHQQHHSVRQGYSESMSGTASSTTSSSSSHQVPYACSVKLQLHTMPPDHPPVDPRGVCPIVHGSQQRERLLQQQQQQQLRQQQQQQQQNGRTQHGGADSSSGNVEMREQASTESSRGLCRWAKMSDQWRECRDNGPAGHDCYPERRDAQNEKGQEQGQEHEKEKEKERHKQKQQVDGEGFTGGYFDSKSSSPSSSLSLSSMTCPVRHQSHSLSPISQGPSSDSGSMYSYETRGEDDSNGRSSSLSSVSSGSNGVNPFSVGPSSPKMGGPLRRTGSVGRSSFASRKSVASSMTCLSGACGPVCRCSGEDEETRAVKAMDAARKRMSVHSLLC
ncbi:hypothetical protein BGZ94_010052 [Podila epigama]|nr:hypothetical protein BGZ94_010052 [Podila epigama]